MWTPRTKWQTCWPKVTRTIFLRLFNIMNLSTISRSHFFLSNGKQSSVMSKRSQEGLSDDSPTVKAKPRPRAMNLVSHRNLSLPRQSSQKTNDFEFPVSNRTDMMLASFGEPSQKNAYHLSLHSQERPQGIASRIWFRTFWRECKFLCQRETVARNVKSREFRSFRTGIRVLSRLWETGAESVDTRKEHQTRIS